MIRAFPRFRCSLRARAAEVNDWSKVTTVPGGWRPDRKRHARPDRQIEQRHNIVDELQAPAIPPSCRMLGNTSARETTPARNRPRYCRVEQVKSCGRRPPVFAWRLLPMAAQMRRRAAIYDEQGREDGQFRRREMSTGTFAVIQGQRHHQG